MGTISSRLRRRLIVSALIAAPFANADALGGKNEVSTVGSVASDNGLTENGWAIVKTPSIMRIEMSDPVPADITAAIANYDRIIPLKSADPALRAEAMRRTAYLRVQKAEANEAGVNANDPALHQAIAIYQQLLRELPDDPGNDTALYQLAHAYQLVGDTDHSIAQLELLGRQFPASPRAPDGVFRVAELQFSRQHFAEAEADYRTLLDLGPATPYFQPAEYKYGWSLYQQARYAQAIPVFLGILDRELPKGNLDDADSALANVKTNRIEVARDSLRVASLSFAALGGGKSINDYFSASGEPRFATLVYNSVATQLLEKQRYTDAAATYSAYIDSHPASDRAPEFQTKVIDAYHQGGFNDLVLQAKETFANRYAPGAPYWGHDGSARTPSAAILAQVRTHMDDIAHHYQAFAQATPVSDDAQRRERFLIAASWYQRTLSLFPGQSDSADLNLLLADALFDGGKTRLAAEQYAVTAYGYHGFDKSPEAAFAAVQAYQRLANESANDHRDAALRDSVSSGLKLADAFPVHPQWTAVLTQASRDLMTLGDSQQAIAVAQRVLSSQKPLTDELRRQDLAIVADSEFAQQHYAEAETAYTALVTVLDRTSPVRETAMNQLAASIYKQAEHWRDSGDLQTAATTFLRVGRADPTASIRVNADFDAASAFIALKNWSAAESTLEDFRVRFPQSPLLIDVDKHLATAYEKDNKPRQAADAYTRIARRPSEATPVRQEAAWMAASLYDTDHQSILGSQAYEYYLTSFSPPMDRAMQARRRIADISRDDLHDNARYQRYLQDIIVADRSAGSTRTDASHLMAAQACLEIGRSQAEAARHLALILPLEASLAKRQAATEVAITALSAASAYGFADVTTAATFELGSVYRDFGRAIMDSSRPANLRGEALEQYNVLLEEQASPFEDKAILAFESNLNRMKQGLWNDWIHQSATALLELEPAKYGKHDQREALYDSLL